MMFGVTIDEILTSWSPINVKLFLGTLSVSQWYRMSISFDLFCLMVSFKIPNAVDLSVRSGVGGWMCYNSASVTRSGAPLWAL
jgi:hypothetical protein